MVFTTGQVVWRFPIAFVLVIALMSIALIAPLPDTPRWYYAQEQESEGDSVLQRLTAGSVMEKQVSNLSQTEPLIHQYPWPIVQRNQS